MNKQVTYDDIDDYEDFSAKEISNEDFISRYCIAIFDVTNNRYRGCGVILTPQGIFVSVAHNFNKDDADYIAYFNQKPYEVEILHIEYEQGKTDLAIGRLIDFFSTDFNIEHYPVLTPCDDLSVGNEVNISGFKSYELPDSEVLERITLNDGQKLSKQRISKQIPVPDNSQEITLKEYEGKAKVYLERVGAEKYCGFSGGPVYIGQNLYGLVISHFFLKSDYIKLRLTDLNISDQIY